MANTGNRRGPRNPVGRLNDSRVRWPHFDGFEFVRELRKRDDGREVPVIVVSAKDITPEERDLLRTGVENIIEKSAVSPGELLAEIRSKVTHVHSHG